VFDLIIHLYWGVCLRMYAFKLFSRRVWIAVRVLRQFGNIYTYRLHVWQMHYGVRVLHLQDRHVLILFHLKCMPATLNAYSLHLSYLWPLTRVLDWRGCFLRQARTCTAPTHWHARTRTDVHAKALRWRKSVRLTVSSLLPTVRFTLTATNYPRCRPQSSPAWAPCSK